MDGFRRFLRWFARGWPLWVTVGMVVLPGAYPRLRSEESLVVIGTIYQLVGIIIVVLGVDGKIRHFYGRSIGTAVWEWFSDFPGRPKTHHLKTDGAKFRLKGSGHLSGVADPAMPVEEQLQLLWNQLEATRRDVGSVRKGLAEVEDRQEADIRRVKREAVEERRRLGETLAADFKVELFGAVCLSVGVVFGTLPSWCLATIRLVF